MAKILLSIPDELLKKLMHTKRRKKIKRNQFFLEAAGNYFKVIMAEEYFNRRKRRLRE